MKILKNIYYELRRIRDYLYMISVELEEYIEWRKIEKENETGTLTKKFNDYFGIEETE